MDSFVPEGMSTQAQQIWSMLDDMAQNDPAAYRKFIDRQIKEGKEYMAPPDPHMCVQVMLLGKEPKPLFINFLSWTRVPQPKSPEDAVPVTGAPITQEKDKKGTFSLTSVAFNPKVLEEFGRNARNQADADTLVQLALDYVEHEQKVKVSRTYTVLPESTPLKGDLELVRLCFTKAFQQANNNNNKRGKTSEFDKDVSELEKTFGPLSSSERESLMSQLSNISVGGGNGGKSMDSKSSDKTHNSARFSTGADIMSDIKIPGVSSKNSNGSVGTGAQKSGLIQEISEDSASTSPPKYTIERTKDGGGRCQLELKVHLPGVTSVAQCELDISEDDVKLVVPGKHNWKVQLPTRIDSDEARAKFSKKSSLLTLFMPVKS